MNPDQLLMQMRRFMAEIRRGDVGHVRDMAATFAELDERLLGERSAAGRLEGGEVMSVPTSLEELIAEVKALGPADKVTLFKALGMSRVGSDHNSDCLAQGNSGIRCNCVPDAPMLTEPHDVVVFMKETWEDRLARAQERDRRREEREQEYARRGVLRPASHWGGFLRGSSPV
jgi:hypothetical protein